MSYVFPETPILLYPSLVRKVGADAALLLTLYQQRVERLAGFSKAAKAPELLFSHEQWLALGEFWSEERLAQLTNELVNAHLIAASFNHDGRVQIQFIAAQIGQAESPVEELLEPEVEIVSRLPVMETAPPPAPSDPVQYDSAPVDQGFMPPNPSPVDYPELQDTPYYPDQAASPTPHNVPNPGPAPTFGGSIGWAKKAQQMKSGHSDELQARFFQQEQLKKQLQGMELNWQPSDNFYALLPRHNISPQFAQTCLDEFVLYWLDKDRKETNWDQKFLGWVKREWVKKQTQDGRQQRLNNEQQGKGFSHENPRRDSREKRQRVTAAIMDIKDTDW